MIGLDQLFSVSGKVALVTGGGRGLGLMMTKALIASGAKVYIASRKREVCEKVAAELGGGDRCIGLGADLSTEAGCKSLAAEIASRERALHVLVNNAGTNWGAPLAEYPDDAWDKVLALNVKSVFHLTRTLLPQLKAAATDADCVVTDTWVSMGDEDPQSPSAARRHNLLRGYQVDQHLMKQAKKDAIFMHCLPAHRGEEVTAEVIDGPQSVVFDEAENRLHAQKSILAWCLS